MIKLNGDLMFDKTIIKILFGCTYWNETHIIYWLNARNIKYIDIKKDKYIYIVTLIKNPKNTILNESKLKGEHFIYFYYL
jgi:hypothetical protein